MAAGSTEAIVERRLAEGEEAGDRFLDLRIDLVRKRTGEILLTTGGRYDRRDKRYSDEPARVRRVLGIQEAQVVAARWFAEWFAARRAGEFLRTPEGKPIFSVALVGGRRAGKSDLAIRLAIAYAVAFTRSIVWIVTPTEADQPEIDRVLEELLPAGWYTHYGDPLWVYTLETGSEIHLRTSYNPDKLKRGRADFVVINEAQLHVARTFAMVAPPIADKGGLVVLAANPPETARGEWVEEYVEKANAGRIGARVFVLDPRQNTEIVQEALTSLDDFFDERTLRREIKGEFGMPRPEAVFYAFSQPFNVERAPEGLGITIPFLRSKLNVEAVSCVHGMDFQKTPWQCSCALRFFTDPDDPTGDPLVWIFDETLVEQGTEKDLVMAMEAKGHTAADPIIADASGEWQDSERVKGRASFDILRQLGWRKLYLPDANSRRNPPLMERLAVGNSLLRSASGRRKLRIDPRCIATIRSVKLWENRNGAPNRRSDYAHAADHWTYPCFRLFPRRIPSPSSGRIEIVPRSRRSSWEDHDVDDD